MKAIKNKSGCKRDTNKKTRLKIFPKRVTKIIPIFFHSKILKLFAKTYSLTPCNHLLVLLAEKNLKISINGCPEFLARIFLNFLIISLV